MTHDLLIEQLSSFELGKFLLKEGAIDGYWTDYVIRPRAEKDLSELSTLEQTVLTQFPLALATQERFILFQKAMQPYVKEGVKMASIPCGVMRDLITLDFSGVTDFSLTGIDIDPQSLTLAQQLADERGISSHVHLSQGDAWKIGFENAFDLITSNGLTIYEPSDEKVLELFALFFRALKPGGVLVTSSMTPPPVWKMDKLNLEALQIQRTIIVDIVKAKWQSFRTEEQMLSLLKKAGFKSCEVRYDRAHLFPTYLAVTA